MKRISFLFLAVTLVGCTQLKVVKIESQPPGARIFFGSGPNEASAERSRSYLGTTPMVWTNRADSGGYFIIDNGIDFYSTFVKPAAVFYAEPPSESTNLFPKKQVFYRPAMFQAGDKVPEGVFFDLTKPDSSSNAATNKPSGQTGH